MTTQHTHTNEVMGDRYAKAATVHLGYPVRFVGWVKQHPSGATEPQFAVSQDHLLHAYKHGLCVQVED